MAKKYHTILADPPWSSHQGTALFTLNQIKALPVLNFVEDDAVLGVWTTTPFIPQALAVIDVWDFEYEMAMPWLDVQTPKDQLHRSAQAETRLLLFAKRGVTRSPTEALETATHFSFPDNPIQADDVYRMLENFFPSPYLELFATHNQPGWDAWGNPEQVHSITLGVSAKYLNNAEIQTNLARVRELWAAYTGARWEIGDIASRLIRRYRKQYPIYRLLVNQIARVRDPYRIATLRGVSECFPPAERDTNVYWTEYYRRYVEINKIAVQKRRDARKAAKAEKEPINEWIDDTFDFKPRPKSNPQQTQPAPEPKPTAEDDDTRLDSPSQGLLSTIPPKKSFRW